MKTGTDIALLVLRLTMGLYFLLAGWGKMLGELEGIGTFYRTTFRALSPDWLPAWLGMPYGYALPWLEILVGALMILGLWMRWVASVALAMIFSFTIALIIAHSHISAQAGDAAGPFHANYIFMAVTLLLIFTGAGSISVDSVIRKKS